MAIRSLVTVFVALLASSVASASQHDAIFKRQSQQASILGPQNKTPFQDPFYTPVDANWRSKKPGDILQYRQIKNWGNGIESAWQLLYRTQSQNETATHTVTTIWVPTGAFKDRFILAGRPDNSVSYTCAPSTRFTNGTVDDQRFFDKKWIVTSVDHEGPDAAFGAGRLQGRLMLDAGRAVLKFSKLGLAQKSQIVIPGYSGGAGAAGWAATLHAAYAPELNVVGAAFGGVPADLGMIAKFVDGGLYGGLSFLGLFGTARAYQAVTDRLHQVLTKAGNEAWAIAGNKCLSDAFYAFAGKALLTPEYNTLGAKLLQDPILKPVLDNVTLAHYPSETPKFPMLVYNGIIDQIIPIAAVDAMVDRFCASGANIIYRRTILAEHFTDVSDADVVPFVSSRFEGKPFQSGCRRVTGVLPFIPSSPDTYQSINNKTTPQLIRNQAKVQSNQQKQTARKDQQLLNSNPVILRAALRQQANTLAGQ